MGNTSNLGLPYPAATAPPDVPGDIYNLATTIDGLFRLIDWTPTVAGFTVKEVQNNYVVQTGRLVIGAAFLRLSGPISAAMVLNLPVTSARMPGVQVTVGDVDYIYPGENLQWRGRLLCVNSAASQAAFAVDVASGRNNQISPTAISPSTNAPFTTASTGDFFVNLRLQYVV